MGEVRLSRLHLTPGSHEVYVPKVGHDDIEPAEGERIERKFLSLAWIVRSRPQTYRRSITFLSSRTLPGQA